jgi:putative flippase GtrA
MTTRPEVVGRDQRRLPLGMATVAPCVPCAGRLKPWQISLCGTRARLHADDASAQFLRFVFVGVLSTAVYFGLYLALSPVGQQPANLVGNVASTMLANELHRRLTFHAGQRVSWLSAQMEGGGLAAIGLLATSAALAALDGVFGSAWWSDLLLIACVTGAVGLVRFVALRLWVFPGHRHMPAAQPA